MKEDCGASEETKEAKQPQVWASQEFKDLLMRELKKGDYLGDTKDKKVVVCPLYSEVGIHRYRVNVRNEDRRIMECSIPGSVVRAFFVRAKGWNLKSFSILSVSGAGSFSSQKELELVS